MNSALLTRLRKGFASEIAANLTRVVIQVGGVPLFLAFWGMSGYGEWLLLTAILGYLRLSSIGFGQATRNRMAMEVNAGERDRALRYFQSTSLLFVVIGAVVMLLTGIAALAAATLHGLLNFAVLDVDGLRRAMLILSLVIGLNLQVELLDAGFRAEGHYGLATALIMASDLVMFGLVVLVLVTGGGLLMGVSCYLVGAVVRFLLMRLVLRRLASWITFGWRHATFRTVKEFTLPSLAFMAFPLGQAMGLQGTLIIIGALLGPAAVVVFSTVRMLSRYTVHLTVIFARVGSPEIAFAYGQGDRALIRQVHWQLCRLGFWAGLVACSVLALATPRLLDIWTGGRLIAEPSVYLPLLAAVLVWAAHTLIANVLQATNNHQSLALAFLGISLPGLALTVLMTWIWTLPGTAFAGFLTELALLIYVLPGATRMTGGTVGQFIRHLATPPSPAMLRHLKARAVG